MPYRIILTLAVAAVLALPGAAFAREGESGGRQGTTFVPTAPVKHEAEAIAPAETTDSPATGDDNPSAGDDASVGNDDPAGDDNGTTADDPAADDNGQDPILPELAPAFLKRTWRLDAEADGFDADTDQLSVTVDRVRGVSRKLRRFAAELRDADGAVLVTPRTRVTDRDGRVAAAGVADALDQADVVQVTGKVLDPKKWVNDDDDQPLVTVRAKRIRIRR